MAVGQAHMAVSQNPVPQWTRASLQKNKNPQKGTSGFDP